MITKSITSFTEISDDLDNLSSSWHDEVYNNLMNVFTQTILPQCIAETPLDTGALRASERVVGDGTSVDMTIAIEATAPYAIYVHEDLTKYHPIGKAKFIEDPLYANLPLIEFTIVNTIDNIMGV